jgi:hypothetical protein
MHIINMESSFSTLPNELIHHILTYVPPKTLVVVTGVNTTCREIALSMSIPSTFLTRFPADGSRKIDSAKKKLKGNIPLPVVSELHAIRKIEHQNITFENIINEGGLVDDCTTCMAGTLGLCFGVLAAIIAFIYLIYLPDTIWRYGKFKRYPMTVRATKYTDHSVEIFNLFTFSMHGTCRMYSVAITVHQPQGDKDISITSLCEFGDSALWYYKGLQVNHSYEINVNFSNTLHDLAVDHPVWAFIKKWCFFSFLSILPLLPIILRMPCHVVNLYCNSKIEKFEANIERILKQQ